MQDFKNAVLKAQNFNSRCDQFEVAAMLTDSIHGPRSEIRHKLTGHPYELLKIKKETHNLKIAEDQERYVKNLQKLVPLKCT